jgi:hypothetical protein
MSIWTRKNNSKKLGFMRQNNKYNRMYGTRKGANAGAAIIHKIEIADSMIPKWLQQLKEKRKIKEQEELIQALKRPENQHRRPAAKFANRIGPR